MNFIVGSQVYDHLEKIVWGPCFTSPKNAVVLLFLDLFRLLCR